MLRRLVQPLQKLLRQVAPPAGELVGVDGAGNKYFRQPKRLDGKDSERRWIDFKGDADPISVPVEWTAWLAGTRAAPPTAAEVEAMERQRGEVKLKARLLDAEEEKRRFRAKSLAKGLSADDVGPRGMERLMSDISAGPAPPGQGSGAAGRGGGRGGPPGEPRGRPAGFQPEVWQPPDPPQRGRKA